MADDLGDGGEVIDIVASRGTTLASWRGAAFCLGQDQLWIPLFSDPLHVHADALDWLRAGRRGIVTVESRMGWAMLHHRRLFTSDTPELAAAVRDLLAPPASPKVEVIHYAEVAS